MQTITINKHTGRHELENFHFVAKALGKNEVRAHLMGIYFDKDHSHIVATDGARVHYASTKLELDKGIYRIIKQTKTVIELLFVGDCEYPDYVDICNLEGKEYRSIDLKGPIDCMFTNLVRSVDSLYISYQYFSDAVLIGNRFECFVKSSDKPVLLRLGEKCAAIMPIRK